MFEQFTERARQIVVIAQQEARDADHEYIGTEHFVLALAAEPEHDWTARFLAEAGLDAATMRDMVLRLVGRGSAELKSEGHQIPFTPRAKKLLELGLREALGHRHASVEPEHLLLALNRESEGPGVRVLRDAGAGDEQVQQAVVHRFTSHPELFPTGERTTDARRGPTMRARPAGSISVEPDSVLAHALRLAAARAVSDGRDQYGVDDLISILGQQFESS